MPDFGLALAVYLVDERGIVAYRALWSNQERVLREGLGQPAAAHLGVLGEREHRMVPMMTEHPFLRSSGSRIPRSG